MKLDDSDRFPELYAAVESSLGAFIRGLVPNRCDALEISQNTAIVLWKKYDTFRAKHLLHQRGEPAADDLQAHFKRWAMSVARYEVLSWRRDKARDRHVFSDQLLEKLADESEALTHHLEDQRTALSHCLKKLPEERREILLEAYSARNKPQEIASRTGKTLNAFYQWMHRIRQTLGKCAQKSLTSEPNP